MNIQTEMILKRDWDILIILDACRYDFFKGTHSSYLKGGKHLEKVVSPATWTLEWLVKTFSDDYLDDVIYISGNPQCNSIKPRVQYHMKGRYYRFDGKQHFFKIENVFLNHWDKEIQNCHPSSINKQFMKSLLKHKDKKFILHYNNPHLPYFSMKEGVDFLDKKKTSIEKGMQFLFPELTYYKINRYLWKTPSSVKEAIYRKHGMQLIKLFYLKDLQLALKHISSILSTTNKKMVITADHGEMLGEHGKYGHPHGNRDKQQIDVPWWTNYEIKF